MRSVQGTEAGAVVLLRSLIQLQDGELAAARLAVPILVLNGER